MYQKIDRSKENRRGIITDSVSQKKNNAKQVAGFVDSRPKVNFKNIQQDCTQLAGAGKTFSNVIQRVDSFYPNAAGEPHIHEHNGGITYTDIGHGHKNLQVGDQIRHSVIQDVMGTLQNYGTERANQIIAWIENRFDVQAPVKEIEKDYVDPDTPQEWLDAEQAHHNPEGHAPQDFHYQGGYNK